MSIDIGKIREQFPSLSVTDSGRPRIYFDNPGGTQVPQTVIDRMVACLIQSNANLGGYFPSSRSADALVAEAHEAMADFLNAASPAEIVFGQNMTSLTFHISRSLAKRFSPGDEIIVTRMDHDANISPWLLLARDNDLKVRWLDFDPNRFEFDVAALDAILTPRTRLAAINFASNATGTINDVKTLAAKAKAAGALVYVDAVQYAPHGPIDVQDLGCDFLVCSSYKFFGPHQGILWGRQAVLEELEAYKVRPATDALPGRFETGTMSHEGMAGVSGAVDYLAWIGETMGGMHQSRWSRFTGRRKFVHAAMDCLFDYEMSLTKRLIDGLAGIPGVTVQGITDPAALRRRVPTVSFTVEGHRPVALAEALARDNIFVWDGHNYAVEVIARLGLADKGGVLRVGIAHYNTADEVDQFLQVLRRHLRMNSAA